MNCSKCNAFNDPAATKCFRCGNPLNPVENSTPTANLPTGEAIPPAVTQNSGMSIPLRPILLALSVFIISGLFVYWFNFRANNVNLSSLSTTVPSDWQTATSKDANPNYTVRYPSQWTATIGSRGAVFVYSPDKKSSITIGFLADKTSFSPFYTSSLSLAESKTYDTKVLSHKLFNLAGGSAEQTETTSLLVPGKTLYQAQTEILIGTSLYKINFQDDSKSPSLSSTKEIYAKVANSFTVAQ